MKRNVRRRRALVVAALLLVLGLAVYLTLDRSVFVARDVQVEGNAAIAADDIIRAANLPLGSPMREVSEEKARAALKSSGTVELVSLEKHYPSLVVLNVRERRCDAVVSYAGVILTMERDGTVISQPSAMPETDAVYVTGLNVTAVSYTHLDVYKRQILKSVRQTTKGRLIALFGCGGDRDHGKRPIMGEIAGELADLVILTSDNPRNEDPFEILDQIEEGIRHTGCEYTVIEDRRAAIRHALSIAESSDVIVLAGKGHETYQEIKGVKHPFDEKIVVKELLREMRGK